MERHRSLRTATSPRLEALIQRAGRTDQRVARHLGAGGLAGRIAIEDLQRAIMVDAEDHGEQLPVVRCTGTKTIRTRAGNTLVPVLSIIKWTDRPDILDRPDDDDAWDNADNADAGAAVETAGSGEAAERLAT
jgi:hypothetical protein